MQLFCFIHLEKLKQRFNGIYYRGNYLLRRFVPFEHVEKKKPILTGLFLLVPRSFAQINLAKTLEQKNQSFHFGFSSSVLETGLEPVRTNVHWILSPTCLPIPPLELAYLKVWRFCHRQHVDITERKTGFEPATPTLAR